MRRYWQCVRAAWTGSTAARRRPRGLKIEQLEDRRLLSGSGLPGRLPNVTYHGGPLLEHVQLEAVYYGQAWNTNAELQEQLTQVNEFLRYFTSSPYMDVLQQYDVGHGTFLDHHVVAQDPPDSPTIGDSDMRALLEAEIAAENLHAPTADSAYVFFVAPEVASAAEHENSRAFAGYHDTFTTDTGAAVNYIVVPYPTDHGLHRPLTALQRTTLILSHQIAEVVTNPDTETGWFDERFGEIGDLGAGHTGVLHGYVVQGVWSEDDGRVVVPNDDNDTDLRLTGKRVRATAGASFTGVVATIRDADPGATADSFAATIDWGDGQLSEGRLNAEGEGRFEISGTHTYAEEGRYPILVTVLDPAGAILGTVLSRAKVAPAPSTLKAKGTELSGKAGEELSAIVATFTSVNPEAVAADFTATIDWGDGTTSDGVISADPEGGFVVTGTHTYTGTRADDDGKGWPDFLPDLPPLFDHWFLVTVTIQDNTNDNTATAISFARVQPAESQEPEHPGEDPPNGEIPPDGDGSEDPVVPHPPDEPPTPPNDTDETPGTEPTDHEPPPATGSDDDKPEDETPLEDNSEDGDDETPVEDEEDSEEEAPALTSEQRFVTQVYLDLLGRAVDAEGLAFWTGILSQSDISQAQVVQMIEDSLESRQRVVHGLYWSMLDRDADAAGLNYFVTLLGNGDTVEQVQALIVGSIEYFQGQAGGTSEGFLQAVYEDVLKRAIDAEGQAFFDQVLASGASRSQVADLIFGSVEYHKNLVEGLYGQFLQRAADADGVDFFLQVLKQGGRRQDVLAFVLGSEEYRARL